MRQQLADVAHPLRRQSREYIFRIGIRVGVLLRNICIESDRYTAAP